MSVKNNRIHFGTDGIRGLVPDLVSSRLAYEIGQAYGQTIKKGTVVLGQDTRLSSPMLALALASGLMSVGVDVIVLGVTTTPMISFLVHQEKDLVGGAMVSASHNPYFDNGIKLFNNQGHKLSLEMEREVEENLAHIDQVQLADHQAIGRLVDGKDLEEKYIAFLHRAYKPSVSGLHIVVDCANGSAYNIAKKVLEPLDMKIHWIHDKPDGLNINEGCGSTHLASLKQAVQSQGADLGIAFDGDGDRVLLVDEDGHEVVGDQILWLLAKDMQDQGKLANPLVVTTVMANMGLGKALAKEHIGLHQTDVGDKYVMEALDEVEASLGGEQSGHIILKAYDYCGDGLLVALAMLDLLGRQGQSLKELTQDFFVYPQVLVNVEVDDKVALMKDPSFLAKIEDMEKELGQDGRLLVRASGTQPMVRIMAEASTKKKAQEVVDTLVQYLM